MNGSKLVIDFLKRVAGMLRFKKKIREGYRCDVCGKVMVLDVVDSLRDIEVFKCYNCGSQVVWKYNSDGAFKSVWDNLHGEQYKIYYDYNYLKNVFEDVIE